MELAKRVCFRVTLNDISVERAPLLECLAVMPHRVQYGGVEAPFQGSL